MVQLARDVEQQLADMSPTDFAVLSARLRAPDLDEQFRDIAKAVVPCDVLELFLRLASPVAFVDEEGNLDAHALRAHLIALFGPLAEVR